jgi:hypothetical protein
MPLINATGRHEVTVKTSIFGESNKGTPFLELSFEDAAGDTINGWLYLSEGALKNTVKTLRETFNFDGNFETLTAQVDGKKCAITVEEEEFEQKMRLKVKWINPLRSVTPIKDGNNFLKSLTAAAARLPVEARAAAKSTVTKAPPAPRATTPTKPAPAVSDFPLDEDVPF